MKSRKRKILKLGIMCLMPLLALLITISNSYAYYLDSDGNVKSANLFNKEDILSGKEFNGTEVVDSPNWFVSGYVSIVPNNSYYLSGKSAGSSFITYDNNYNVVDSLSLVNGLYNSSSNVYYIRFNAPLSDLNYIMFNEGTTALSYEPYGIWYNEESYETQKYLASLSNITDTFNMAIIEVIDSNNNDAPSEVMYLNNTSSVLNFSLFPSTIQDYVNNYNLSDDLTIRIILYSPTQVAFYFNSQLNGWSISINSENLYLSNYTLPLTPDNYQTFGTLTDYSFTISPNFVYRVIDIEGFRQAHTDFSISLSTDNYFYRDGYNDGYNNGVKDGYNNGVQKGRIDGYNDGYNVGSSEDLTTNGFKTLISTILSYPVNMVRESLNFEFMGIHVASIVLFVVSLGIVAFVIKRFKD